MPTTMRIQLKFGQGLDFAALGIDNGETWDFEVDQNCTIEEVKHVLLQLCDGELSMDQLRLRRKDSSEELAEYIGADRACTSTFQPRPCTLLYHGIKSGSVLEVDILLSEDEKAGLRAWQAQVEAVNNQHAGQGEKRRIGGDEGEGGGADADFMRNLSPPPKRRKADAAQQGSGDPMDWAEGQATGPGQVPPPPQQAPPPPQQHHLAPEKTALVEILVDSDDDYVALVEPLDVAGAPQHAPSGEAPPPKHPGRDQPPPPRPQQQQATGWEQAHGSQRQQQRGQPATEPQQGQAAQQWQKKAPAGQPPQSAHGQTQQAAAGRQDTVAQGRQQPQVPRGQQQQVRQEPQGAERRQPPQLQHPERQPQQPARQQPPTQAPERQQADQPQQRPQAPGRQRPQVPQQVQRQQQQQPVPEQPLPQVPEQQPPPQVPEQQQQQPGPRQQQQPQAPQRSPAPQTAGRQPQQPIERQQQQPPGRPPLPMGPTQHQQQQRHEGQAAQEPGAQRQQAPMQRQQQAAPRQEPGAAPNTGTYGAAGGVESDDEGADGGGLQARGGRAAQRPLGRAKWTIAETQALADAMETYGKCWAALEREAGLRDQKTLRYKWRNLVSMCKAGWVGMRGVQLPQPLRDQITALYQRLGA